MERLTKENVCQRQDINQSQFTNRILEERIKRILGKVRKGIIRREQKKRGKRIIEIMG